MSDIGFAMERLAPNPDSGQFQFGFTNADSGVQALAFHQPAAVGGFEMIKSGALWVCVKTTVAVHLQFGPTARLSAFGAITNANSPMLEPSDSVQDFLLMPGWDAVRMKGDAVSGTLYIWPSGR